MTTHTPEQREKALPDSVTDYVMQYGGKCRDCADENGCCPSSGLPCEPAEAREIIKHVLDAVNYGLAHGYIKSALTAPPQVPQEVVDKIEAAKVGLAVLNALDETETAMSAIRLLNEALALLTQGAVK